MEYLLKLVVGVLFSLSGNMPAAPGAEQYEFSAPVSQHIITVEHNNNILGNLLGNINGAINQLMFGTNRPGEDDYSPEDATGWEASKTIFVFMILMSVFLFLYNLLIVGGDRRMIQIIPLFFTITLFWWVLYAYERPDGISVEDLPVDSALYDIEGNRIENSGPPANTSACDDGDDPSYLVDDDRLPGFIGLSHDIVTWTSSIFDSQHKIYAMETHGVDAAGQPAECYVTIRPSSMVKNPWALMAVQSNIADQFTAMADQVEKAWDLRHDESEGWLPSVSSVALIAKSAVLFLLVWVTKAVMFVCFGAISLVIFLNVVFLKVVGLVSMFIIPLVLFEPLKNFAQGGLTAILSFAIKFLTYIILISFLLAFITNIRNYIDEQIQNEVGRITTVPDDRTANGKRRNCLNAWRAGELNNPNGVRLSDTAILTAIENWVHPELGDTSDVPEQSDITAAAGSPRGDRGEAGIHNDRILAYCVADAPGVDKSISFIFFMEIMFVIIVYTLLLLLLPGKVVQVFDKAGIAFGDGQVAGWTGKALQASALMGAGAAISMAKTSGAIAGGVAGGAAQSFGAHQAGKTIANIDKKVADGQEKTVEDAAAYSKARQKAGASAGSIAGNMVDRLEKSDSATARGAGNVIKGVSAIARGDGFGLSAKAASQQLSVAAPLKEVGAELGPDSPEAKAHKAMAQKMSNLDKTGHKMSEDEWAAMSDKQKSAFREHQRIGESVQESAAADRLAKKIGEKNASGVMNVIGTDKSLAAATLKDGTAIKDVDKAVKSAISQAAAVESLEKDSPLKNEVVKNVMANNDAKNRSTA